MDAARAERCGLDTEHWSRHNSSVTTHFNACPLSLIYFFISDSRCTRDRGGGVCCSSGKHATNLAKTTDGVGWDATFFPGFQWLFVCNTQPSTLIKIVRGKGSECSKAGQRNCSCLWQEGVHFPERQMYTNKEASLGKHFSFWFQRTPGCFCWWVSKCPCRWGQEVNVLRINIQFHSMVWFYELVIFLCGNWF